MVVRDSVAEPLVVGTVEAARMLRTGVNEVRELAHAGELKHYRTPGGHMRFSVEGLREYIERQIEATA